jgi:3-phenylpropionate/cinnamic acid dioxygenase small subunit
MALTLQDESDIGKVLIAYATGIDSRDFKLFRTCFADDAQSTYNMGPGTKPMSWSTGEALTQFMVDAHLDFGYTLHHITNIVIKPAPEGATARSYVHAVLMKKDGSDGMDVHGFYDDVLVKTKDGWKIKTRVSHTVKAQGAPPDIVKK